MKQRRFMQVDVFTSRPGLGNPVAVVLDAEDLGDEDMQTFARWTNLSETTFVLPATDPAADYRLRIFTPRAELPFAGHPTLGSVFAAARAGLIDASKGRWTQQCGVGLVTLTGDGAQAFMLSAPQPAVSELDCAENRELLAALGVAHVQAVAQVDIGASWITVQLSGARQVLTLTPDMSRIAALSAARKATGVTVFGAYSVDGTEGTGGSDAASFEIRSFAPLHGVDEDPVCGSGNAAVALLLRRLGRAADYQARQGRAIGRDGFIRIEYRDGQTLVGGRCVAVVEGTLNY